MTLIAERALQIIRAEKPVPVTRSVSTSGVSLVSGLDFANYSIGDRARDLIERVTDFMDKHIVPLEAQMEAHVHSPNKWQVFPPMQQLKDMARREGLWNLFIPPIMAEEIRQLDSLSEEEKISLGGPGLTNVEYSFVAERMGRCVWASEVFNCSPPDTGNMEILARLVIHCLSMAI